MYAVVFGKNPRLSEGEFHAFIQRFGLKVRIVETHRNWLLFESDARIEHYFHWLGGALKLVKILGEGEEALKDFEYSRLFTISLYGKDDWRLWRKFGGGNLS